MHKPFFLNCFDVIATEIRTSNTENHQFQVAHTSQQNRTEQSNHFIHNVLSSLNILINCPQTNYAMQRYTDYGYNFKIKGKSKKYQIHHIFFWRIYFHWWNVFKIYRSICSIFIQLPPNLKKNTKKFVIKNEWFIYSYNFSCIFQL